MSSLQEGPSIVDRVESIADGRPALIAVGGWALIEAVVFPVVPDVLLYALVVAAPRRLIQLFGAAIVGALVGSAILAAFVAVRPAEATSVVIALPAIDESTISATQSAIARDGLVAFAGFGPGTPLKVDTLAWTVDDRSPLLLVLGVVLNRVTRIGPGVLLMATTGLLAPRFVRRHARPLIVVYAAFWLALYAAYWS